LLLPAAKFFAAAAAADAPAVAIGASAAAAAAAGQLLPTRLFIASPSTEYSLSRAGPSTH